MRTDTYKQQGQRRRMVERLMTEGITDEHVLEALRQVPRHFFFESDFIDRAYENKAFPIGEEQTISQPYTVAFQSQLLQLESGMQVLEVGTGSGYQACVLAAMGAKVYSMERNQKLYERTKRLLNTFLQLPTVVCLFGDGYEGAPQFAPFDRILVTAGAPTIPQALIDQLRVGGLLVIPVDRGKDQQVMIRLTKLTSEEYKLEECGFFRFVPLLKGKIEEQG